jgi:hypothetical protein
LEYAEGAIQQTEDLADGDPPEKGGWRKLTGVARRKAPDDAEAFVRRSVVRRSKLIVETELECVSSHPIVNYEECGCTGEHVVAIKLQQSESN